MASHWFLSLSAGRRVSFSYMMRAFDQEILSTSVSGYM